MYSYIDTKEVNVKLFNGEIFTIQIGDLDETHESFVKNICNYDENIRLRNHRINMFIQTENNEHEEYNFSKIKDGDTVCVVAKPPPYPNIEESRYVYNIDNIENFYDTIDSLFDKNYEYFRKDEKLLDFKFKIKIDDTKLIQTLLEYIPFNEIQTIKFSVNNNINYNTWKYCGESFIEAFTIFLEKSEYFSFKTLDLSDITIDNEDTDFNKLINLINNKIFLENLYINFRFLKNPIYINTENLYVIFPIHNPYFKHGTCLDNLINTNHTVFSNKSKNISNNYLNIGKDNNNDKYYIYKHVSKCFTYI